MIKSRGIWYWQYMANLMQCTSLVARDLQIVRFSLNGLSKDNARLPKFLSQPRILPQQDNAKCCSNLAISYKITYGSCSCLKRNYELRVTD